MIDRKFGIKRSRAQEKALIEKERLILDELRSMKFGSHQETSNSVMFIGANSRSNCDRFIARAEELGFVGSKRESNVAMLSWPESSSFDEARTLTLGELRRVIKEECRKIIRETRDSVGENELFAAFEKLNSESGAPTLDELAVYLGVAPRAITKVDLYKAGLEFDGEHVVERI